MRIEIDPVELHGTSRYLLAVARLYRDEATRLMASSRGLPAMPAALYGIVGDGIVSMASELRTSAEQLSFDGAVLEAIARFVELEQQSGDPVEVSSSLVDATAEALSTIGRFAEENGYSRSIALKMMMLQGDPLADVIREVPNIGRAAGTAGVVLSALEYWDASDGNVPETLIRTGLTAGGSVAGGATLAWSCGLLGVSSGGLGALLCVGVGGAFGGWAGDRLGDDIFREKNLLAALDRIAARPKPIRDIFNQYIEAGYSLEDAISTIEAVYPDYSDAQLSE